MKVDDLSVRHLRGVVALAEELDFGRAAHRTDTPQAALTQAVACIEEATGARLFDRTARSVSLTPVGEIFVAEARAILSRVDEVFQHIASAAQRQTALFRLVYSPLAGLTVTPKIRAACRARSVRIEATEMPSEMQRLTLSAGRADLALADEAFRGDEFSSIRLHREPLVVVLPEKHPLAARASVGLKELRGNTFLLHPRGDYPEYYDRFFAACAAAGFTPKIRYREPGVDVLDTVLDGGGIVFTPGYHTPNDFPELRFITLDSMLPLDAEVWAVWLKDASSPQLKALVAVVEGIRV